MIAAVIAIAGFALFLRSSPSEAPRPSPSADQVAANASPSPSPGVTADGSPMKTSPGPTSSASPGRSAPDSESGTSKSPTVFGSGDSSNESEGSEGSDAAGRDSVAHGEGKKPQSRASGNGEREKAEVSSDEEFGDPVVDRAMKMIVIAREKIPKYTPFFEPNIERYLELVEDSDLIRYQGAAIRDLKDAAGLAAKTEIPRGTALTSKDLVPGNQTGHVSVAIPPGMRAITVPFNKLSGVFGFLKQGDLVDIYHHMAIGGESYTYVVLQAVEVLTIDTLYVFEDKSGKQRVTRDAPTQQGEQGGPPRDRVVAGELSSITFAVAPLVAQKLVQATGRGGSLSVSLRGRGDDEFNEIDPVSDNFFADPRSSRVQKREEVSEIEIYRGSQLILKEVTFDHPADDVFPENLPELEESLQGVLQGH